MIRLDGYGNEIKENGVIRTDSGKLLSYDYVRYNHARKILTTYFPSKILIADHDLENCYSMPVRKGDKYVRMDDGKAWSLIDIVRTPQPYSRYGIEIFQPKDNECVIKDCLEEDKG